MAENAQPADETMAVITFAITDEVDADVPVHVELAQLANDSSTVKTGDQVIDQVVQGDINLSDFLLGDVNGDGTVDTIDTSLLSSYTAEAITLEELDGFASTPGAYERSKINADDDVNTMDTSILSSYTAESITLDEFLELAKKK